MTKHWTAWQIVRWCLLGVIVAFGAVLTAYARSTAIDNAFRNAATFLSLVFTAALLAVWFVFASGLRWRTRFLTVFSAAVVIAGSLMLFQVDGFYGDLVPQFRWRWSLAKDYRMSNAEPQGSTATRISLRSRSPSDFPRFLGLSGRGTVEGIRLARDWTRNEPRLLWRQPVGAGWSGFAVASDYAVTQEQRGEKELVTCYELKTGRLVWSHEDPVRFSEVMGGDGPRATPTIVDGQVYAMGATGILNCLDGGTGKVIWSRDILADHRQKNLQWGKSCSPLVFDDIVVVTLGDSGEPSLAAYTGDSGRPLWQAGHDKPSYATPVLATLLDREQIVVVNQTSVAGHDAAVGDLLWEYSWPGEQPKCSNPVPLGDDRIFISTGYGVPCAMLQLKRSSDSLIINELWTKPRMKTKFTNVVVRGDFAYGLDDGILACLELSSGEQKWKGGRYGHGQLLLVDDTLLVTTETGAVVLVDADPAKHHELARFSAINGKSWNNPALAGRYLLVRSDQEAACYELPALRDTVHELSQVVRRPVVFGGIH